MCLQVKYFLKNSVTKCSVLFVLEAFINNSLKNKYKQVGRLCLPVDR